MVDLKHRCVVRDQQGGLGAEPEIWAGWLKSVLPLFRRTLQRAISRLGMQLWVM